MKSKRLILLAVSSLLVISACAVVSPTSSSPTSSSIEPSTSALSSEEPSSSVAPSSESSSIAPEKRLEEKTIKVYRLFNRDNSYLDPDLSEDQYKLGDVSFSFIKGQYFVPYITLDDLSNLYGRFYKDKNATKNIVTIEGEKNIWKVINNNATVFTSIIDTKNKTFTYSGDVEGFIEGKKDYSNYSFNIRSRVVNSVIELPSKKEPLVSYADTEFEVIKENDTYYFPFSMMHTFYHELTGHDFFFNYTYLYEFNEIDDISKANITEGEKVYTIFDQMSDFITDKIKEKDSAGRPLMPLYLRKYHRSELTLIMNNYYGLAKTWGVTSMLDYYKLYGLYDKYIDENSAVRGAAYAETYFMLSDSHTGRVILGDNPWVESNGNAEVTGASSSTLTNERNSLGSALTDQREKFLKANGFEDGINNALIYSSDGKTAYFGFDSFDAYDKAFNEDGTPKSDDKLAKYDSYFYFVEKLKEIKNHGGVENVIIDDSLNGGGYVNTMGRLLALISKNNQGTTYLLNGLNNSVIKSVFSVDTNNDGKFDDSDCYGNTFKFYILTSPKSFSCGNAFPILAQNYCGAKVFGAKSGGGECVVGQNYLSNAMGFVHSSNEHLILLDEAKKTYKGVEDGVGVDGGLKYNLFYNMEEMIKVINSIK